MIGRTPIEDNNTHKLYAGNQLECGKFFEAVFPVSNNVIYAVKGTSGALASSNTRYDVGSFFSTSPMYVRGIYC